MAQINSSTSIFNPAWRRVWSSLSVLTCLLLLVEGGLRLLPEPFPSRTIKELIPEMMTLPTPVIQVYGESVTYGAINDWVVADAVGMSLEELRNDAVPSTCAFFAYPLLKRQIQKGIVPKVIVLGYVSRSYCVSMVPKFLSHVATLGDMAETAFILQPPLDPFLQGIMGRVSFAYRYRAEYNDLLRERFSSEGLTTFTLPTTSLLERQRGLPRVLAEAAADQNASQAEAMVRFFDIAFAPPAELERSLDLFLALAREHGIRVLLVSMPKPASMKASHEASGFDQAYDRFMDRMTQHEHVSWLVREQASLPASDFMDGVHLTRAAGFRFSQDLGQKLKAYLEKHPLE